MSKTKLSIFSVFPGNDHPVHTRVDLLSDLHRFGGGHHAGVPEGEARWQPHQTLPVDPLSLHLRLHQNICEFEFIDTKRIRDCY